jgi:hypothetical protein
MTDNGCMCDGVKSHIHFPISKKLIGSGQMFAHDT